MKAILLSSLSFSVLALMVLAFRRFRAINIHAVGTCALIVVVLRMDPVHAVGQPGGDPCQNKITERIFQAESPLSQLRSLRQNPSS